MTDLSFAERIAADTGVSAGQATAVLELLDTNATIPFIARYRKDVVGGLDENRIEAIAHRQKYYASMANRRAAVLDHIARQGKLTDELRQRIEQCSDKSALEDLYLPYKKKRRTRATVARDQGLGPLADFIWAQVPGEHDLQQYAASFVRAEKAVASVEQALDGAVTIIAERISMDTDVRAFVRHRMVTQGRVASFSTKNAEGERTKYASYYDFSENAATIPSHRFLAILRGVKEGFLRMELAVDEAQAQAAAALPFAGGELGAA